MTKMGKMCYSTFVGGILLGVALQNKCPPLVALGVGMIVAAGICAGWMFLVKGVKVILRERSEATARCSALAEEIAAKTSELGSHSKAQVSQTAARAQTSRQGADGGDNPKRDFPDPLWRLEWLKSKIEEKQDLALNQPFSISQELYDIAEWHPDLTDDAVIALAKCFARVEGDTFSWSAPVANLLVALGPRATAAIPHLVKVIALPMPPGYDRPERFIDATPALSLGDLIKSAQEDARRILGAIRVVEARGAEPQSDNPMSAALRFAPTTPSQSSGFVVIVTSVMNAGDCVMIAGTLKTGRQPQAGDKFSVSRTGKTGTVETSTNLGAAFQSAMQAGASVAIRGTGSTLGGRIAFTSVDVESSDVTQGDRLLSC